MHIRPLERWCALLSSLLLGAGLGCVLCLIPSPLHRFVLAGLTPILLLGSVLGGGLGTACLLLLWWDAHRSTPLLMASEPPSPEDEEEAPSRPPLSIRLRHSLTFRRVLHAWRVVQPEPVDALLEEETSGISCHRCGVPAPRASLLRCAHCHHLFHKTCCLWMAGGHGVEEALCQPCWNEQEARRRRRACQAALWAQVDDQGEQEKGGR